MGVGVKGLMNERVNDLMERDLNVDYARRATVAFSSMPSRVFSTLVRVLFGFPDGIFAALCSMPLTMSRMQHVMSWTWGGGLHPVEASLWACPSRMLSLTNGLEERSWRGLGEAFRGIEGF